MYRIQNTNRQFLFPFVATIGIDSVTQFYEVPNDIACTFTLSKTRVKLMNITIISSTNRAGSMSLKVSLFLQKMYEDLGATTKLIDLQQFPASCFTPQVYAEKPPELTPFIDAILGADGVLFVIPEYNGSFPGMLKYYIDMWKFPDCYVGLKSAYVGIANGQWGALRAVEQFQGVMGYRNAIQFPNRVFINKVGARWNGDGFSPLQKSDPPIDKDLKEQAKDFLSFCEKN